MNYISVLNKRMKLNIQRKEDIQELWIEIKTAKSTNCIHDIMIYYSSISCIYHFNFSVYASVCVCIKHKKLFIFVQDFEMDFQYS